MALERRGFELLAFATAWVLVSVSPLLTMFFVSDNLEGARYVYLGSAMWSVAVVALIAVCRAARQRAPSPSSAMLIHRLGSAGRRASASMAATPPTARDRVLDCRGDRDAEL